jgi:hypothetical protein
MSSDVVAPAAPNGDNDNHQGHCSRCGKVWILNERQGVCQWCGHLAVCQSSQTKPRHIKSSRRRKQRQANRNGYDQLPDPYLTYYRIGLHYAKSVPTQDTGDLLHTIIMTLADVACNSEVSEPAMYRIASRTRADYWRENYRHTRGLDCGHCSNPQRKKCQKDWLYGECPKAIKIERLSKPITDSEGNLTELGDLIADDTALDIPQWLDIKEQLLHTPDRALAIAGKIQDGQALTNQEHQYLWRFRHKAQKELFEP